MFLIICHFLTFPDTQTFVNSISAETDGKLRSGLNLNQQVKINSGTSNTTAYLC